MTIFYLIYFGLILISNYQKINGLSCRGENGKRMDFYVIYKPPKNVLQLGYFHVSKESTAQTGLAPKIEIEKNGIIGSYKGFNDIHNINRFGFFPGSHNHNTFTSSITTKTTDKILSNLDIGDVNSFVGKTFSEVYKNPKDFNYIMFSDENPDGTVSSLNKDEKLNRDNYAKLKGAKLKGVLAWSDSDANEKTAILFLHSVPKWLPKFEDQNYGWPEPSPRKSSRFFFSKEPKLSFSDSLNRAHMALCVNLKFRDIKDLIKKLIIISDVKVYDRNIRPKQTQLIDAQTETFTQIKDRKGRPTEMYKRKTVPNSDLTEKLQTLDGTQFTIYTKPKNRVINILRKMSRDKNSKPLNILSRSFTQKYSSLRTKKICKDKFEKILKLETIQGFTWSSEHDDGDWAVSAKEGTSTFCFCGFDQSINIFRQSGLMVCFDDINLHSAIGKMGTKLSCEGQ